jgi:hypothetical protein
LYCLACTFVPVYCFPRICGNPPFLSFFQYQVVTEKVVPALLLSA